MEIKLQTPGDDHEAYLEIFENGDWKRVAGGHMCGRCAQEAEPAHG